MPTVPTSYSRAVRFNADGEGLDFTDITNAQIFARSQRELLMMSGTLPNVAGDPGAPGAVDVPDSYLQNISIAGGQNDLIYVPHPGLAFVYPTGAARTVQIVPGPVFQWIDEPWNQYDENSAMALIPGSLTLQTAVGDATNPRIDLVEVLLSYVDGDAQDRHFEDATTREPTTQSTDKERSVQLSYQIKQGTPAATPSYPNPSSGYVPLAAIYVPATHNAVHSADNFRDLRMPFGCKSIDVDFTSFQLTGANPWVQVSGAILSTQAASTTADAVIAPCPIVSPKARLLGVAFHAAPGDDFSVELVRLSYPLSNAAPTVQVLAYITDAASYTGDGSPGFYWFDEIQIMDLIAAAGNVVGTRAAGFRHGTPVWLNGKPSGMSNLAPGTADGGAATHSKLALRIAGDGGVPSTISFVRFWYADGL